MAREIAGLETLAVVRMDGAAGALVAARAAERERRVRVMAVLNIMSRMIYL